MKKSKIRWVVCLLFVLGMMSCQTAEEPSKEIGGDRITAMVVAADTASDTASEEYASESFEQPTEAEETEGPTQETKVNSESQTEAEFAVSFMDVYLSMEEFLDKWWTANEVEHDSILIPVMKSPNYYLAEINDTGEYIFFYYLPVNKELPWYDEEDCFCVCICERPGSFDGLVREYGLVEVEEGVAGFIDMWVYNDDGKYVQVRYPQSKRRNFTIDDVEDYFTFVRFYAPTETDADQ